MTCTRCHKRKATPNYKLCYPCFDELYHGRKASGAVQTKGAGMVSGEKPERARRVPHETPAPAPERICHECRQPFPEDALWLGYCGPCRDRGDRVRKASVEAWDVPGIVR